MKESTEPEEWDKPEWDRTAAVEARKKSDLENRVNCWLVFWGSLICGFISLVLLITDAKVASKAFFTLVPIICFISFYTTGIILSKGILRKILYFITFVIVELIFYGLIGDFAELIKANLVFFVVCVLSPFLYYFVKEVAEYMERSQLHINFSNSKLEEIMERLKKLERLQKTK